MWPSSLLLMVVAVGVVAVSAKLPSQYEASVESSELFDNRRLQASCPNDCNCDAYKIECKNTRQKTTALLRHASPRIYESLDSLIVTGNDFGRLPYESLFGGDGPHQHLSLVKLSSNGITAFGAQTLIDAPRVEYLYLRDNRLNELFDEQPLKYLTSLKLLDLTSALDTSTSARSRADLLKRLFANDHDFIDLNDIMLSGNRLEHIHSSTFCRVRGLTRLILRNNALTSFVFDSNCLDTLNQLDLRNNKIVAVPTNLWRQLPQLNSLDVSRNPLACSCEQQQFHSFALDYVNEFTSQQETTCASPTAVRGRSLFDLEDDFCRGRSRWYHWIVLMVAAGVVGMVVRWLRRGGASFRLPPIGGYTQLTNNRDETPVAPAFV